MSSGKNKKIKKIYALDMNKKRWYIKKYTQEKGVNTKWKNRSSTLLRLTFFCFCRRVLFRRAVDDEINWKPIPEQKMFRDFFWSWISRFSTIPLSSTPPLFPVVRCLLPLFCFLFSLSICFLLLIRAADGDGKFNKSNSCLCRRNKRQRLFY